MRVPTLATSAVLVLTMACTGHSAPESVAPKVVVSVADSGVRRDLQGQSRWVSEVQDGRVTRITERVRMHGTLEGSRVYTFDRSGVLRRVDEDIVRVAALDSTTATRVVSAPLPHRVSVIDFHAYGPILARREYGSKPMPIRKFEMRQLETRGYALLQRATGGR